MPTFRGRLNINQIEYKMIYIALARRRHTKKSIRKKEPYNATQETVLISLQLIGVDTKSGEIIATAITNIMIAQINVSLLPTVCSAVRAFW